MKSQLLSKAGELGFISCRITTANPIPSDNLVTWLSENRHGTMRYMARDPQARCDPSSLLPGAKSVICCALKYDYQGVGRRARFARGPDYHIVVREKLAAIVREIERMVPSARTKCCVDTSPIMEKALAQRAGLGWIGKHSILVNPHFGSWFVLGEIITDVELEPDGPMENRCGDCRRCLDACPTSALDGSSLDARRCISYLTIEFKDMIDPQFTHEIAEGSYGCDICQEVCPYNRDVRY